VVLEGKLKKLNFTNPHASIELSVPDKKVKGKVTDWKLTTASVQTLTREGINKTSMKPGEVLKVTILPAKNGSPTGFIRNLQLGDRSILLFFGNDQDWWGRYQLDEYRHSRPNRDCPAATAQGPGERLRVGWEQERPVVNLKDTLDTLGWRD
jgi:hypothetical protein